MESKLLVQYAQENKAVSELLKRGVELKKMMDIKNTGLPFP